MAKNDGKAPRGQGLPFLPGNTFVDPTKERFHVSNSLTFKNGYSLEPIPRHPIGGGTIELSTIKPEEVEDMGARIERLTVKKNHVPKKEFIPAHKEFDKKVLKFIMYFKETVFESPAEHFRVRIVDLYYYLEDDTIMLLEPHVENSGIPQGQVMQRQHLPMAEAGHGYWTWRDLNLGINLFVNGRVYRIVNCDEFTRNWYCKNSVSLSEPENLPVDPYTESRCPVDRTTKTKSDFDKMNRFLLLDRKVLQFDAVYDDRDALFGDLRRFIFHYYLVDDTLEMREVYKANDGRDPFPVLLRRQRLPIDRFMISETFPTCVMELTNDEVQNNWLHAKQFIVGKTLTINKRKFLIYECDDFTRWWFKHQYKIEQPPKISIPSSTEAPPKQPEIPPYNGFGSLQDTVQNCLSLIPQPPKKDFIKMLENDNKTLRYAAKMVTVRPEDKARRFIINYRLANDMISIYEPPIKNSGIIGGMFLEATRISKPDCDRENPVFYGPADLSIGKTINVFRHRFTIVDCDDYVLSYLMENKETFPEALQTQLEKTIQSIADKNRLKSE